MGSCLSSDSTDGSESSRSSWSATSSATSSPSSPGSRKGGRRRMRREMEEGEEEEEEELHKIQGRRCRNGASDVASLFTQQGKKGTNQDAMIVWENFGLRADTVFCGIFDGHGPYGHMVARRVRDSLPLKICSHWEVNSGNDAFSNDKNISAVDSPNSEENGSLCLNDKLGDSIRLEEKEKHPKIFSTLKDSFFKAYKLMDKELKLHPSIDCFCSGTTAVTLVKHGKDLVVGNVGDSRAVLGTRDQSDRLTAVQLTVDLKPNLPKEEERIRQYKGRVFSLRDEPEVARVWLPNTDSPGLAMARAFGDFCLKNFGVISVPEIYYRRLTEKDEFIVLATDGVWDVLSNKEVVDIVASAPSRSSSARLLVESAVRAWRYKYPSSKIDDCAVICLFLIDNSTNVNSSSINIRTRVTQQASPKSTEKDTRKDQSKGGEFSKELALSGSVSHPQSPSDVNSSSIEEGSEWSALEGVSRVNTLLTLPRLTGIRGKRLPRSNSRQFG